MEWQEADPIPAECQYCEELDCYNCDAAGKRWYLSRTDELRLRREGLVKAIERFRRRLEAIDMELLPFTDMQRAALAGSKEMTYDMFWECLQVCFANKNMEMYMRIWHKHPEHVQQVMQLKKENK